MSSYGCVQLQFVCILNYNLFVIFCYFVICQGLAHAEEQLPNFRGAVIICAMRHRDVKESVELAKLGLVYLVRLFAAKELRTQPFGSENRVLWDSTLRDPRKDSQQRASKRRKRREEKIMLCLLNFLLCLFCLVVLICIVLCVFVLFICLFCL